MRLQGSGTPLALNEHLAVPPRMHIQNFQKKLKGSSTIHHLFGPVSWLSDTTERCSHSSCFNQIEMCRSTRRLALRTGKIGAWRKHRRSRISGILNVSALENRYLHPPIHRDFSLYPYYEQSIHHINKAMRYDLSVLTTKLIARCMFSFLTEDMSSGLWVLFRKCQDTLKGSGKHCKVLSTQQGLRGV